MIARRTAYAAFVLCAALPLTNLCGCRPRTIDPILPGVDRAGLDIEQRRMILAQIVDDPRRMDECATLEAAPYRYLLTLCTKEDEGDLHGRADKDVPGAKDGDDEDKEIAYEQLKAQGQAYRGRLISRQGVMIEVEEQALPAGLNLPGYKVVAALFVTKTNELFQLRILVKQESDLAKKITEGFAKDKSPVYRVTGFFMKCHAKMSAKQGDRPWREPLLVCPEPSRTKFANVDVKTRLEESHMDVYLPSKSLQTVPTEERLILELATAPQGQQGTWVRAENKEFALTDKAQLAQAVEAFRRRVPSAAQTASAVVLRPPQVPDDRINPALSALREAGVRRVFYKDEGERLIPLKELVKE